MNEFITYNQFIKREYQERCENKVLANIYKQDGGFKTFKRNYISCYHFTEYFQYIWGNTLTKLQVYHIARAFNIYGKYQPSRLPWAITSVCREFNLELPPVEGILTQDYWQERFFDQILPNPA